MRAHVDLPIVMFVGLALAAPAPCIAQISWSISADHAWDNAGTDTSSGTAQVNGASVSLERLSPRFRLFTDADLGDYAMPGSWAYLLDESGASLHFQPGNGSMHVYTGGRASVRVNGDAWGNRGFRGVGGFANAEWSPREEVSVRGGIRVDQRWFPDAAEFEHAEVPSSRAGGSACPHARPHREPRARVKRYASPAGAHAVRVDWLARVAQSLTERTGAFVQVNGRNAGGDQPSYLLETPILFFDDGVYDDPFAHDLSGISAGVTHLLPGGAQLSGTVGSRTRDFANVMALDADGNDLPWLRQDEIAQAGIHLRLPLHATAGGVSTSATLGYEWTRSTSTDPRYTYGAHRVLVAASLAR
jgi:hypothetical protein